MSVPGWHPDPLQRHQLRWYDGTQWTAQVSDAGTTSTDPMGVAAGPATAPADAPAFAGPSGGSNNTGKVVLAIVGAVVVLVVLAAGTLVVVSGDDGSSEPLTAEVEGLQSLIGRADPDEDDFELLEEECVVEFEDLLEDAGVDVPARATDEEAAVYNAVDFDQHFYDCYVAVDPAGFFLDAVELDEDVTVDQLADLLDESADDSELLDDGVQGGDIIEACHDTEITDEDRDPVDDPFCEYYWTFDGAGLAIVIGANESLDLDGPAALDTVVPPFREALRDAGE